MVILNKQKCQFFFSFIKPEKKRVEQVLSRGVRTMERGGCGETVQEGEYGHILCTHECKWKNETC
jgi:hypothetical protein